ncbi:MAG: cell division protein FtsZ [Bacteroidales bacterium]
MIRFDLPKDDTSIIKVIGVGGGGCNAVNHMFNQGIQGVDFIICNTDAQSLNLSPIPIKIQLGSSLTEGRGAGSLPSVGRNAALENIEDIRKQLERNTKMLFITAGMGGGTGTGAAPVIASVAKELNILTVGIVTIPFNFEGSKRRKQAEEGIKELREHVDSLLVICNDKLRELCGDLPLSKAFHKADNILTTAAKGIAEIITVPGYINVDFEDVKTVMKESGVAIMGSGIAEGEDRALLAVEEALTSPLLNDNNIDGANNILLYISSGTMEVTMDEVTVITDYIQTKAGKNADIIWGNGSDPDLGEKISITLVATGFETTDSEKKAHKIAEPNTILVGVVGNADTTSQPTIKNETVFSPPQQLRVVEEIPAVKPEEEAKEEPEPEQRFYTAQDSVEAEEEISVFEDQVTFEEDELEEEPAEERIIFELYATAEEPEARKDFPEIDEVDLSDFNFTVEQPSEPAEIKQGEDVVKPAANTDPGNSFMNKLNMEKTTSERINKLRELSLRLKTPDGIDQLEKEPAYLRGQVDLAEPKHSSESEVSQFSVSGNNKGGIELKQNNSYLHDQPD